MKNFKLMLLLVIIASFAAGVSVWAGNGNDAERYFISGSDFGVEIAMTIVGESRHEFKYGFTSDLASGQVLALEILSGMFNIFIEPVDIYNITKNDYFLERKPGNGGSGGGRVYFPSDRTPWGVEKIYNNSGIVSTSGGLGVNVAVLDTGVYKNHLDLSRRISQCKDFTGRVAVKDGSCDDKNGHGTHVAGTILADGGADSLGIYGVAPEAKLFAYKVCGNSGSCWADDIAMAIRIAADNNVEIISMSLGGNTQSSLIRDAITYAIGKGALIVAAAGNDGPTMGSIDYPGANVNVIAVGAIDINENVPDWSSRGINNGDYIIEEQEVEFGAPGVAVESTWIGESYKTISGTSMATPHISGLAAKLWQGNSVSTRTYLRGIARDMLPIGDDPATGFGMPFVQ